MYYNGQQCYSDQGLSFLDNSESSLSLSHILSITVFKLAACYHCYATLVILISLSSAAASLSGIVWPNQSLVLSLLTGPI